MKVSKPLRDRILKAHGNRCFYCGGDGSGKVLEIDHRIPLASGGTTDETNLVPSCKKCNLQKHSQSFEEWQRRRGKRG